ncbi:MAG TPA: glycosyltransferase [Tepidisphaeraceae bacterium]|nr:glycosyltransferase [Tepidisphaeraceae bacterium]
MKIVIFGLTVTSSWGNGHATLWRGLCRALARRGHSIVFFEKDVPYYASERDLEILTGCWLHMYRSWNEALPVAIRESSNADVAMVTSFCPDGAAASDVVLSSSAQLRVFYDMDTPVTLEKLRGGEQVFYLPSRGLGEFDLVLSYTGGAKLENELRQRLGARRVAPLYGSVDPELHHPVPSVDKFRADLSYMGTYAADRQAGVEELLLEPARRLPERQFSVGGAQYPPEVHWTENVRFTQHVAPPQHAAFYCSSRLTLNVTRKVMADMGYCPSGRFFEAAACGTPILSDWWEGLDQFYKPGSEILIAHNTDDAVGAVELSDRELSRLSRAARERTMAEHTAERRAIEFENAVESARQACSSGSERARRDSMSAPLAG